MINEIFSNIICKKIKEWHEAQLSIFAYQPNYPDNSLERKVESICYHNYQGWHFEDLGQLDGIQEIIHGWRGSQANNRNRNRMIQEIDNYFAASYQEGAEIHTESLGVILDKLSILYIKYSHLADIDSNKAKMLYRVINELVDATQSLYDDIMVGKKRCIMIPHLKLYDEKAELTVKQG